MRKRAKNIILCGLLIWGILFGSFPDMALAEEKGIVISNVTSNSADIDWSDWAAEQDYLCYDFALMDEEELGGADPNKVETYNGGWMFGCGTKWEWKVPLESGTKYYVCVRGSYYDWNEDVDTSNGREEKAVFAQFTTKGSKVKLNKKAVSLTVGKKATVKLNGVALSKQSFKSSNKKVAKVSGKGVVTAVKKGTCKITVTDKSTGKKYICKVTVKDKKR